MKIYLTALGCRLNQAEIETLARSVQAAGHHVAARPEEADWAIINTCTVTHIATRKSRQLIRHLRALNPHLRLAVTGCYAQISADELQAIEGVDLIAPNADKGRLVERLLALSPSKGAPPATASSAAPGLLGHTRAFVKVQDGCDNHCAYCIVAIARGPQRSRPPAEVLSEVRARVAEGYQEAVLTGVHIGAYGRDSAPDAPLAPSAGWSLARLIREILEATTMRRVRLSSIEPWDLSPELVSLWPNPRLCRQVHLPLQSGCDAILRRMGRKYSAQQFEELVGAIRRRVPAASITTDVIVGFRGESEEEHKASLKFVERMRFSRLHVFKYSPRPGTPAANMPGQIPAAVTQARSEAMIALGRRLARDYHGRFVGEEVEVLCESAREEGGMRLWTGLTDNYLRVTLPSSEDLANALVRVRCLTADEAGLRGELLRA
jgi:threonylcarbamoyladenosine tRNA methylthiotransferase MtaB